MFSRHRTNYANTPTSPAFFFFVNRVFNIKLAPPQLAALMAVFDKDNDGTVDCAEFLLRFFLIGFQVRGRGRRGQGTTSRGTRKV